MKHAAPADPTPGHASFPEQPARRRLSAPKIIGIVAGSIVGLLLIAYVAGGIYFSGRFMPNTTLGNHDVSLQTAAEVQATLEKDAGVSFDGEAITAAALGNTNPWLWPLEITRPHDETDSLTASSSGSNLATVVRAAVDEFNATATPPTDAVVTFDEQNRGLRRAARGNRHRPRRRRGGQSHRRGRRVGAATVVTADALQQPAVPATDPKLQQAAAEAATSWSRLICSS